MKASKLRDRVGRQQVGLGVPTAVIVGLVALFVSIFFEQILLYSRGWEVLAPLDARFLGHLAIDLILLMVLGEFVLFGRRWIPRQVGRPNRFGGFELALVLSLGFLVLMPFNLGRIELHQRIDSSVLVETGTDAGDVSASYCQFPSRTGLGEAGVDPAINSVMGGLQERMRAAFQLSAVDVAGVLPVLFIVAAARRVRRRFESRVLTRGWLPRFARVGLLVGVFGVVLAGIVSRQSHRQFLHAVQAQLGMASAQVRTFKISAIPVTMTLNRFGDHDPLAFMYVLDENVASVRREEVVEGGVTIGLRQDSIQPLILRANLGDTVVIEFTNRLPDGDASLHVHGLAHTIKDAGGAVGLNPSSVARPGQSLSYVFHLPTDPTAERAYYFRDHGASRQRVVHGLFGALVAEPAGSRHLDVETGEELMTNNWEAIIVPPDQPAFREFVLMYHEIGDENFDGILDRNGRTLPVTDDITETYRPSSRAINYRSESFHNRLALKKDKSQGYGSYTFGDPATPIPRSYLGEPTKTRLLHGGSEVFHVHHLHGGGDRWRRNPKADPHNDISSGLTKRPRQDVFSTHLDSQSIGPGTSYNLEHECGAGGCQQAAGDFLFHCHIGHHYLAGMWSFWRVFDTLQVDLFPVPGYRPAQAVPSSELVGRSVEGKRLVPEAHLNDPETERSLEAWLLDLLPPQGVPLDDGDATVWDWEMIYTDTGAPLVLGEPETESVWPNYRSTHPGERPIVQFNPDNARYAWPLFRPHLGQRPPFSPNGHSGAPWLGEKGSARRPDGLWPGNDVVPNPSMQIRQYPITAITRPIQKTPETVDDYGMLFVLGDEKDAVQAGEKPAQPLAIRSNVGDGVRIILTSELEGDHPELKDETTKQGEVYSKVNMHTHFVQFDPQASDGVITGFSYEQSVRPYASERRTLDRPVAVDDQVIFVTHTERLREGVWIGVGLGEGMKGAVPLTEIRQITEIEDNAITLDRPLTLSHEVGEAVGVEFVQYAWYSDVDTGTVFWHDHVNFKTWDHGLFGAHIIEPAESTYHDPFTGDPVRSGTYVSIHAPDDASIGAGQSGSFREFILFSHNRTGGDFGADLVRSGASINLLGEPMFERGGDPAYVFSSVKHGDPLTPLPRAYVGDPFVIRHLAVVERVGGVRVTGHRFRLERWAGEGALSDTSPIGISERFDLVLDGGAGGPAKMPGDYLYYSTVGRDMVDGAWGLIRVHDAKQSDLQALPGREPLVGEGFPRQVNTGDQPQVAEEIGEPGPPNAPVRHYEVEIAKAFIVTSEEPLRYHVGEAFMLADETRDSIEGLPVVREPLILRVNEGEVLEVALRNRLTTRAGFSAGELLFDPNGSYGAAIGYNRDSTVAPGDVRMYRYFADRELGTTFFLNLANVESLANGGFGGLIVEPERAVYLDPYSGRRIETGAEADIVAPSGNFREFVTLFTDNDPVIGQSRMPYPRDVSGFTGINYRAERLADRGLADQRSQVFSSVVHGDPSLVFEAHPGDPVRFRVAAPWAEQMHVFSVEGHRWLLEPRMRGSEQVYSRLLAPGYSFDAPLVGGAGGDIQATGDYLVQDARLPFLEAGLWGLFSVVEPGVGPLRFLGDTLPPPAVPVPSVPPRGEEPASWKQLHYAYLDDLVAEETNSKSPIVIHSRGATVELVPGADRGEITFPLRKAWIRSSSQRGWFVLSDASDEEFAREEGCLFARVLAESNPAAVEDASFRNGVWEFDHDPGRVARFDADGTVLPPLPNPLYSPLKRILWRGREVIVNAPLIKWGDEPGQEYIVDRGGFDPLIRVNAPSPFFVGGGPAGATSNELPIERYEGGQVLALNIDEDCGRQIDTTGCASVTMKAQIAIHRRDFFAYYIVFEASKPPPAGFMGVPYAPKLGMLSAATKELWNNNAGATKAVGHIMQFRNGVYTQAGGPKRFQPGLTSYAAPDINDYSPMWHITWLFWDCDQDGVFYDETRNVSFGAMASAGSGISMFDPADPVSFNPFGMDDRGVDCAEFAIASTGNPDGRIYLGELALLKERGLVTETQAPAGWTGTLLGNPDNPTDPLRRPLIVNCPTHVVVDWRRQSPFDPISPDFAFALDSEDVLVTWDAGAGRQLEVSTDLVLWNHFEGEVEETVGRYLVRLPAVEGARFVRLAR